MMDYLELLFVQFWLDLCILCLHGGKAFVAGLICQPDENAEKRGRE